MEHKKGKSILKTKKYLSFCQERDNFRAQLVEMIKREKLLRGTDDTESKSDKREKKTENFITDKDKDILRYYYYLTHGIDDTYVGSMDLDLLGNILRMVPAKWQNKFKRSVTCLVREVKEEYALNVKKSVVEFVIGDPARFSSNQFTVFKRSEKFEAIRLPTGHADSYRRNKAKLKRMIILYCPVMRRIVDYWYREFSFCYDNQQNEDTADCAPIFTGIYAW